MRGRRFSHKLALACWLTMLLLAAATARAAEPRPVAVLLSSQEQAYRLPAAAFAENINRPVVTANLRGDIHRAPTVMARLLASDPALILALGAKAAVVAKVWTSDRQQLPVLFAMVLNWRRYRLLSGQHNLAGIASEPAPGTQFLNLTLFVPSVKRIGAIYSPGHSDQIIALADKAARALGLELVTAPIDRPGDFRRAFRKIRDKIDAFWLVSDPVVYTLENIAWLRRQCLQHRLPGFGQSRNLVLRPGILLAVEADQHSIGSQAAAVAKRILRGEQPVAELGVLPPLGTRIILNRKTAARLGLTIQPAALGIVSETVD